MLLVVLVAITWAGGSLLQMKTESGTLPRNVHDESVFATVAVKGVPIVPTISYEASRGPLGVLPTAPENPDWLLHAGTASASAMPSADMPTVRARYRIVWVTDTITSEALDDRFADARA